MGKKTTKFAKGEINNDLGKPFLASRKDLDPSLASLFSKSSGPVEVPKRSHFRLPWGKPAEIVSETLDPDEELSSLSSDDEAISSSTHEDEESGLEAGSNVNRAGNEGSVLQEESKIDGSTSEEDSETIDPRKTRKRKRKEQDEDIEDVYMRQIARKEAKEETKRLKELKTEHRGSNPDASHDIGAISSRTVGEDNDIESDNALSPAPQHESLALSQTDVELEKSSRTVFLGNVSTAAITSKSSKKALLDHLSSFLPSLPTAKSSQQLESLRFRSTAYASAIPKKAAFAKKELLGATTKSTNAYAVYSTQLAAREAAKRLNGTVVLDRHLRVDEVAHPAKVDHKRCIFVGNLGFVDDESALQAAAEEQDTPRQKQKKKEPADVEEGLWREFGKCGMVESVRVVRDSTTRVGKGFAYVQFTDENAVEAALLFNDKKFPPMLPRKLRVVRAKAVKRNKKKADEATSFKKSIYKPKADSKKQSMQGRAVKLLGKAGASQARSETNTTSENSIKPLESFVFEGHRATASQGKKGLKFGAKGKKHSKPTNRSSKRAAAWKAKGPSKRG